MGKLKYFFLLIVFASNAYATTGAYVLYDYSSQKSQVEKNIEQLMPIASITKLFTAAVLLDRKVNLDEKVKVTGKSYGRVPQNTPISRMNLLKAMLIRSDNLAAETLATTYPGGSVVFFQDVVAYLTKNNLRNTWLEDSSGLDEGNVSTVSDLTKFLALISENETIRAITQERTEVVSFLKGKNIVKLTLRNTNPSLFEHDNILISKTGYTNPAGRCVIMLVEKHHKQYAVIILGQKNVADRSKIASALIAASADGKMLHNFKQ